MTIALGGTATSVTVKNTSGGTLTNVPVTFAMPFKAGELPSGSKFQDMQVEQKATHPDGTIRHAVISYVIPTINSGQTLTVPLVRSNVGAGGTSVTRSPVGFTCSVAVTIVGTTYTADIAAAVASGTAWLTGPICSEWVGQAPLMNGGTAHTQLHARYEVRKYADGRIRVCVDVENTWARRSNGAGGYVWNTAGPITYNLAITINGSSVYTKTSFTQYPYTRWRKTFWVGTQPAIHIAHDISYLIAIKCIPNYSPVTPAASLISSNASWIAAHDDGLQGQGMHTYAGFPTGGTRPELGILPEWQVTYLLSQDPSAKATMIRATELNGSWAVHFRDQETGELINLIDYPYASYHNNNLSANNVNPVTGQSEMIPFYHGDPLNPDTAHHPDGAFTAYLVTGDYYFLEELMSWGIWPAINIAAAYRSAGSGILTDPHEIRGTAWGLRSLAHAAYLAPDGSEMRTCLESIISANFTSLGSRFLSANPNNTLGYFWHLNLLGYQRRQTNSYDAASAADTSAVGIGPWMDDYVTGAVGRVLELGFNEAHDIFHWKAKFPVKRMTSGSEFCWIMGSWYSYAVRATEGSSTLYTTMAQIWAEFPSNIRATACGSAAMAAALGSQPTTPVDLKDAGATAGSMWWSFNGDATGKPMEMQPALAYAVTHGAVNADNAWLVFDSRSQKPTTQLSTQGAQWAILPRVEVVVTNLSGANCTQANTSPSGALSAVELHSATSMRVDNTWIASSMLVGSRGLGIKGSEIPALGLAFSHLSLPADNNKEVRVLITSQPSAGTLTVNEDTTYDFSGAPNGSYPVQYHVYLDGVDQGVQNTSFNVGNFFVGTNSSQADASSTGVIGVNISLSGAHCQVDHFSPGAALDNPSFIGLISVACVASSASTTGAVGVALVLAGANCNQGSGASTSRVYDGTIPVINNRVSVVDSLCSGTAQTVKLGESVSQVSGVA